MKKIIFVLSLLALLPVRATRAQTMPPNQAGASMGHVHLVMQDLEAAKTFWAAMGGVPVKLGPNDGVKFPGTMIMLRKGDPSGGTVGSVIEHIGFTVPNTKEALAKFKAAGLNAEPGASDRQCFVHTPDNLTRIEILENKDQKEPIAFQHVHFFVPDSDGASSIQKVQAWYARMFGAVPGKRGPFDTIDMPGVSLTVSKSDTPTVGTKGRMLDHIGFEIKDLEAFSKKLEANGVKFDLPPTKRPDLGIIMAYITDPWGTYIELTEGLNKL